MKKRCDDETHPLYAKYGGQGISYQESWQDFDIFFDDMRTDYPCSVVLERYDAAADYSKANCFWFDLLNPEIDVESYRQKEAAPVKVMLKYYSYNGEINDLSGFAKQYEISYQTLRYRLLRGWTIERALSDPVIMGRRRKNQNS